ncbi:unnamed protein product [Camellia sinensis]
MAATNIKRLKISKKKKAKKLEEKHDYLTELPEPLLNHILSYLTMKDVIRTSVLAKRWRYTWLYVPCLKFPPMKVSRQIEVAFINRTLLLHKGPNIQELNITFKYNNDGACQVDSWMHFALTRNVNELYLDFLVKGARDPSRHCYRLPHFILSCRSLTVLALKRCAIKFPINFKLSSLKKLSLDLVDISSQAVNDLISSSPILEYLSLTDCQKDDSLNLSIMNVGMKTLKINGSSYYSSSYLEVYAPHTVSLELVRSLYRKNLVINRMQSLESASFYCDRVPCVRYDKVKGYSTHKILEAVHHVKDLRLCSCYAEALSTSESQSVDFLSFDVTCLGIKTELTKWELPGIAYIIRHSPNIETLIISIDKIRDKGLSNNLEVGEYWKLQEPNFIDQLWNLKTVKVCYFMENLNQLQESFESTAKELLELLQNCMDFLKFLLKNSKVLERMIITNYKKTKFGKWDGLKLRLMSRLTQELLAFPRASRDAQIYLQDCLRSPPGIP